MATGAAPLSLTVRLTVGQTAQFAQGDSAGNHHAIPPENAGALLHPAALSAVAGSARRLLALAGASPGADVGVLGRAMEELERLAAGASAMDRAEPSATTSTAADMDIDANQLGGGTGAARCRDPRTKRKLEAPGVLQRPAKRRILAWRVRRLYRSLVAKAQAAARRARSRRAQVRPVTTRRKTGSWKSVEQQLARATLCDGLHRWSPGGGAGAGDGPAEQ